MAARKQGGVATRERPAGRFVAAAVAAAGVLLAAVFAAGASATAGTATKSPAAHIDYLSVDQNTVWAPLLNAMTNKYKRIAPGSSFKDSTIPQQDLNQRIQLLASQNALPLLYNTPANDLLFQMAKRGEVVDVAKEFKKLGVSKDLVPAAAAILKQIYSGRVLSLPLEFNIEGVWYNKKIFAQNGITVPKTWDQLVADAAKLQAKGIQPFAASGIQGWPITRLVGNLIFSKLGADALEKIQTGKAKLTDPQYVWAAQQVADLGKKGYFGQGVASLDYGPAEDVFLQGKAAMFYMGSWALADFNDPTKNKLGVASIGFFPFPGVSGGKGPSALVPMNAGQPTSINPKKLTPANELWLKYIAQHYGDEAMRQKGQVTGFVVHKFPAKLSPLTKLVVHQLAVTKNPVLWFEALFSAKATTVSQQDAAPLVTGQMSPQSFMSAVQQAVSG